MEGNTLPAILNNINWIDIIFVILLVGMIYKGAKTGVGGQVPSLVGYFVLIFAVISYYSLLSEALFGFLLQKWAKPASFFAIAAIIFVIVKLIERIFSVVGDGEVASIEKAGGALIACLRAFILFGLVGMMLLLVPLENVRSAVTDGSKSCMFFVEMDAGIYSWMTDFATFVEKKQKDEVINEFLTSTMDQEKG